MKNIENIDDLRPPEVNYRINARWTNEETMLAVNGVKQFGKDFQVGFFIDFFYSHFSYWANRRLYINKIWFLKSFEFVGISEFSIKLRNFGKWVSIYTLFYQKKVDFAQRLAYWRLEYNFCWGGIWGDPLPTKFSLDISEFSINLGNSGKCVST